MKKTRMLVLALAIALSTNAVLASDADGNIPGSGYVPPPPCAPNCPGAMVEDDPVEDFIISIALALITRG